MKKTSRCKQILPVGIIIVMKFQAEMLSMVRSNFPSMQSGQNKKKNSAAAIMCTNKMRLFDMAVL